MSAGPGVLAASVPVTSRAAVQLTRQAQDPLGETQEPSPCQTDNPSINLVEAPLPPNGDPVQVYATFVVKNISRVPSRSRHCA